MNVLTYSKLANKSTQGSHMLVFHMVCPVFDFCPNELHNGDHRRLKWFCDSFRSSKECTVVTNSRVDPF